MIFVVITAKIIQDFIAVLPIIFDIISSIFLTHLHPAVINISSWCGLESFKEKTFFCKWVALERKVLVVCFLLGYSPASEFYMPTFQNTLYVPSS